MSVSDQSIASKPKRRWYQYSLRTLFYVTAVVAVLCGGFSHKRRVEQQRELIRQEFRQVNGEVRWDTAHWWSPEATWASFTSEAYFHLTRFYSGDEITDDQLDRLKPRLQYVETLFLDGTQVTDRGLEHFEDMQELRNLSLGSTAVTNSGLSHLAKLTRLEWLNLCGTGIPDRTIAWYARFFNRHELKGSFASKVTDAGLANLRQLTRLKQLNLRMTEITDAGLEHLKRLSQLRYLDLDGTQVTSAGVRKLQQSLPNCKIGWRPPTKDEQPSRAASDQPGA